MKIHGLINGAETAFCAEELAGSLSYEDSMTLFDAIRKEGWLGIPDLHESDDSSLPRETLQDMDVRAELAEFAKHSNPMTLQQINNIL